jgi:protein-S-isoprenylcysteine O-methyltransferase
MTILGIEIHVLDSLRHFLDAIKKFPCMQLETLIWCAALLTSFSVVLVLPKLSEGDNELAASLLVAAAFSLALLIPTGRRCSSRMNRWAIFMGCFIIALWMGQATRSNSRFGAFLFLLGYFHLSEFVLISKSHQSAHFDSLLLNHGIQYTAAFFASAIEHFFSPVHLPYWMPIFGAFAAFLGLSIRATALITAGRAFTHLISTKRDKGHNLITGGIYGIIRHPGYCGWFLWVVGAQLLAGNPVCSVAFAIFSWMFFRERIEYEDSLLFDMFGSEYIQYRERTPFSGIPFVD